MSSNKYDLEERTAQLGEEIIRFCLPLDQNAVSKPIVSQLVRSGTSIGANYAEANAGSSRKDFKNKIHISKKEVQETQHWLRMMQKCFPGKQEMIQKLQKETHEFILIFGKIISSTKKNDQNNEN